MKHAPANGNHVPRKHKWTMLAGDEADYDMRWECNCIERWENEGGALVPDNPGDETTEQKS